MELEELIENTLRRKHLEEMMNRPEKEHTPLEGMDNEQIKRFALFLFEEMHIPADTRSAFPVISVHSQVSIQCRWQS